MAQNIVRLQQGQPLFNVISRPPFQRRKCHESRDFKHPFRPLTGPHARSSGPLAAEMLQRVAYGFHAQDAASCPAS